jgi:hypothetical protein
MFDLEQAISDWRRQALAAGIKTPALLDELESHLREDIRLLTSAGKSQAQAFQLAVLRLGNPGPLRTEFNKLEHPAWWPVTIGSWLFVGALILMTVLLSRRLFAGKLNLLLLVHILSFTAGYGAAFLAGSFGIFYVCCRLLRALSPSRQQSLGRAVLMLSHLSAGLVITGMVLGMFWSHQHLGRYLTGDIREFGALCVIIWFVALLVMQRYGQMSERTAMLMCIGGNVIVSLAWFGAAILISDPWTRVHGMASYLPLALAVFLGMNLLFLAIGMAPAPEEA